jgi:hypothetical protein
MYRNWTKEQRQELAIAAMKSVSSEQEFSSLERQLSEARAEAMGVQHQEARMSERLTLLPCPFCGGEPASYWIEGPHHNSRNNPDHFRIACCVTLEARTGVEAAGKWNRRAAPASVAGERVIVPKDPTEAMVKAGAEMFGSTLHSAAGFDHHAAHVYAAMLRAAGEGVAKPSEGAQARRNAERYRWLCDHAGLSLGGTLGNPVIDIDRYAIKSADIKGIAELDAAIDAAISRRPA